MNFYLVPIASFFIGRYFACTSVAFCYWFNLQ
jgi:hypothetical protein